MTKIQLFLLKLRWTSFEITNNSILFLMIKLNQCFNQSIHILFYPKRDYLIDHVSINLKKFLLISPISPKTAEPRYTLFNIFSNNISRRKVEFFMSKFMLHKLKKNFYYPVFVETSLSIKSIKKYFTYVT